MTDTPAPTPVGRRRGPQVNITLTAAEVERFTRARATWTEPGNPQPRTESLARTIKRLALAAVEASQP